MKKASEYREHAEECRALARGLVAGEQRQQLLEMAATWERLAEDRSALVRRYPELSIGDEHGEEQAHHAGPNGKAPPALRADGVLGSL